MENYNNSDEENVFSGENIPPDNTRQNEETAAQKTAKKKRLTEPVKSEKSKKIVADLVEDKKKVLKKNNEKVAAATVVKQVKIKKEAALKTESKDLKKERKPKIEIQPAVNKQTSVKEEPEVAEYKAVETIQEPLTAAHELVIIQDETVASNKPALKKITFQIKFHTTVGQSLHVTGNHALLGNNNAADAFPLNYLNYEYWSGSIEIDAEEDISYNYILKHDDEIIPEWGKDKIINPSKYAAKEILLIDAWNASSFIENTFYTEPFQQVLLKQNFTKAESEQPQKTTHIFKVKTPLLSKGQVLCIAGAAAALGQWDTVKPMLLTANENDVWHTISLDLSNAAFPLGYKYGVFDISKNQFIRFENGTNRILNDEILREKLTVVSDGFARLPANGFKGAGIAIPVFSLRSEHSFGAGEFNDLKLLVDWAKKIGLKLIQILPVNDTTATHTFADSYPYAAISAFALHPLYLHLPDLLNSENDALKAFFPEKQQELNGKPDVDYAEVMAAKWTFIKQIFPTQKQQTFKSDSFNSFFKENMHWLVPYAAFSYLREKYNTPDFSQWPTNTIYEAEQINQLAASPIDADEEISRYYFVQFHLHLQLKEAVDYAHQNGIIFKGDIPIGIYRYSCDAWQEPSLFNMDMQAGAPPDDFAVKGQNWGFPTYNWQRMSEDGFAWWKKRFNQMSYYFDAFRIDHILGFFRIWSIPLNAVEGIMGHFVPAVPVYINEFAEKGISYDMDRFTKPYINDYILSALFENDKQTIISSFFETNENKSYSFKTEFDTQRKIENYFAEKEETEQNKNIKNALFDLLSNVILFEEKGSEGNQFHFRIAMETTLSFRHLDRHLQYQLKELYLDYFYRRQDSFWQKEAMLKLPELKRSTNMLICGEDLGMVPDCVPGVMKDLAILSLEIQRMPKDPKREFFHPNDAPYLSVVTPSTHDMSTIRGWWEEDRAATQRFFINELGQWGTAPYFCEPWINKIIVTQHLYSPAMWSIFQLQDLMGINPELRWENPHDERINIPADPKHYWRYRMHLTLESLMEENEFTSELKSLITNSGR